MADKKTIEAVEKALEESKKLNRKFKQTIDLAVTLKNVDLNESKNRIDEEIILPNGRGKESKIAIFASGELALKAKGKVDLIVKPEEIEDLSGDKKKFKKIVDDYDFFIAEAPLMPTIGKTLGVILGPRGKMPKPVPPQIDITGIVKNLRNTVILRSKANKTFHTIAGKEEMDKEKIAENIDAIIKRLESKLERGRMNISSIYVKTTMGPSVRII
ncbi:MAG: 50S ribosomal protein L1 [Candidatus Thermoplasmatota archaeon]|nr:50S ribosomal protein L1 [Candidatus Thermoplasmatota archaeon]